MLHASSRILRPGLLLGLLTLAALVAPQLPASAARLQTSAGAGAPQAYVGNFNDNTISVLDTASNRVLTTIPVPAGPHGLVATPDGRFVYVSSDGASTVSVIDTATDSVVSAVEVGQMPHGLAITPDGRRVLVAVFGTNRLLAIDTADNRPAGETAVASPHNIAVSPDGRTAYVAAQQSGATALAIVDLASMTQVGSVPLEKTPRALSFSPD